MTSARLWWTLSVLGMVVLAGCTSAVTLRHPQTGQTTKCGPYSIYGIIGWQAAQREAQCISAPGL